MKNLIAEKTGTGGGNTLTYSEMIAKVKQLENDLFILESQRVTVVAVNPKTQAFEYVGQPLSLSKAHEIENIDDLLLAMTDWFKRPGNDRLSVGAVLQSMDLANYGELDVPQFETAMTRLGIQLRKGELQLLRKLLDKNNLSCLSYIPLVRQLQGVPQQDFMNKGINKLAQVAESRDLTSV